MNLGGGPRPTPKTEKGVPVYLHDWFGSGRDAMVVSMRSPEFKVSPEKFRKEAPLTGDMSRVAEIKGEPFPELLTPVDDLPPTTVVTSFTRTSAGKLLVRGTTADNGDIKRVLVNGAEARSIGTNFTEWEATVDMGGEVRAFAEDAAGNIEPRPHVVAVK